MLIVSEDLARARRGPRLALALSALAVFATTLTADLAPSAGSRLLGWLGALGLSGLVASTAALAATHPARRFHVMAAIACLAVPLRTALELLAAPYPGVLPEGDLFAVVFVIGIGLSPGLIAAMAAAVLRPGRAGLVLAALLVLGGLLAGYALGSPEVLDTPLGPIHLHLVGRALRWLVLLAPALLAALRPPRPGQPPLLDAATWVLTLRGAASVAIGQALLLAAPIVVVLGPILSTHGDRDVGLHTVARIVQSLGLAASALGFLGLAALPHLRARALLAAASASAVVTAAWGAVGAAAQLSAMARTAFGAPVDATSLPFIGFLPGAAWSLALALAGAAFVHRRELRALGLAIIGLAVASSALHIATPVVETRLGALHFTALALQAALSGLAWGLAARVRRVAQASALVTSFADAEP